MEKHVCDLYEEMMDMINRKLMQYASIIKKYLFKIFVKPSN